MKNATRNATPTCLTLCACSLSLHRNFHLKPCWTSAISRAWVWPNWEPSVNGARRGKARGSSKSVSSSSTDRVMLVTFSTRDHPAGKQSNLTLRPPHESSSSSETQLFAARSGVVHTGAGRSATRRCKAHACRLATRSKGTPVHPDQLSNGDVSDRRLRRVVGKT